MSLPTGFVYLDELDKSIAIDLKYLTHDNFIGKPFLGYNKAKCIITKEAADALIKAQQKLKSQDLGLKIFDTYRPQVTVGSLVIWSKDPTDQKCKLKFYPNIDKADFFELGYLAEKSSHSRGSTADLTIIDLTTKQELEMGTIFDFMDTQSHTFAENISDQAKQNRMLLRNLMIEVGFKPYDKEWWHFTLENEPFPDQYFNFVVE